MVAKSTSPAGNEVVVPTFILPSLNVTLPDGVPTLLVTVAVKVTDCPATLGFADEPTLVAVDTGLVYFAVKK